MPRYFRAPIIVLLALAGCAGPAPDKSFSGRANNFIHDVPLPGCQPGNVDSPPIIKEGKRPLYPAGQLEDHKIGSGTANFTVTETGAVTNLKTTYKGSKFFASHLVVAMQSWVIEPARKDGHPVASTCVFTMNYGIEEDWPFNQSH